MEQRLFTVLFLKMFRDLHLQNVLMLIRTLSRLQRKGEKDRLDLTHLIRHDDQKLFATNKNCSKPPRVLLSLGKTEV